MDEEEQRDSAAKSSWFADFAFACCCAGFLNPHGNGSKEFYDILGLKKNASTAEIKKAYKKLSLAFHPDKLRQRGQTLTEEMQEKFRKIKQAYEVLSDPQRRKYYDTLGVNGLMLKEEPASFLQDPKKMMELVAGADARAWLVVLSVASLALGFLFLFPCLFALQVDGSITVGFAAAAAPLWIVYALVAAALTASVARGASVKPAGWDEAHAEDGEEWEDHDPLHLRAAGLATFTLFVLFQVLAVCKLDGGFDSAAPWTAVLVPYYLYEAANVAGEWAHKQRLEAKAAKLVAVAEAKAAAAAAAAAAAVAGEDVMPDEMGFEERMAAEELAFQAALGASAAAYHALRCLQVFLVALNADGAFGGGGGGEEGEGGASWWGLLVPALAYALASCVASGKGYTAAAADAAEAEKLNRPDLPPPESAKEFAEREFQKTIKAQGAEHNSSLGASRCSTCCCFTLYLLLLAFYMEEPEAHRWSFFWFYFPFGALLALPCLALACAACCSALGCCPTQEDFDADAMQKAGVDYEEYKAALKEAGLIDEEDGSITDPQAANAIKYSLLEAARAKRDLESGGTGGDEESGGAAGALGGEGLRAPSQANAAGKGEDAASLLAPLLAGGDGAGGRTEPVLAGRDEGEKGRAPGSGPPPAVPPAVTLVPVGQLVDDTATEVTSAAGHSAPTAGEPATEEAAGGGGSGGVVSLADAGAGVEVARPSLSESDVNVQDVAEEEADIGDID